MRARPRTATAHEAAKIAEESQVEMLALKHLSLRYGGGELRAEARESWRTTMVPRDFDRVEIPFPERGEPVHVRRGGAAAPSGVLAPSG